MFTGLAGFNKEMINTQHKKYTLFLRLRGLITEPVIHLKTSCFSSEKGKAKQTPRMGSAFSQINLFLLPPPQKNPERALPEKKPLYG